MPWALRHEVRRIVPYVFQRASTSGADSATPPVDDRGHRSPAFGAIMPLNEMRDEATVRVVSQLGARSRIGLSFTNNPNNQYRISSGTEVDIDTFVDVRIGHDLAAPSTVLQVHGGGLGGPVVARLTLSVFPLQVIVCVLHIVQLRSSHGLGPVPTLGQLQPAFDRAIAYWDPYGIQIAPPTFTGPHVATVQAQASNNLFLELHGPGILSNVTHILNAAHNPGILNVYLVRGIQLVGGGWALGWSTPLDWVQNHMVPRRGLLVMGNLPDAELLGGTIAHEIGHLLGLEHVRNMQSPNADGTSFALRQTMHNFAPPASPAGWTAHGAPAPPGGSTNVTTTRPRFDDVGYGAHHHGGLITLKTLPHVTHDDQASTATTRLHNHPF